MTWAKFDDGTPDHPKFSALAEDAPSCGWLWFSAICYCNRYLTDGRLDRHTLRRLWPFPEPADRLIDRLVEVRLLDDLGASQYAVHDFLQFNPSKAEVLEARAIRARSGQRGGQASAQARAQGLASRLLDTRFNPRPGPSSKTPVPDAQAFASDTEQANAKQRLEGLVDRVLEGKRVPDDPDHWEKQKAAMRLLKQVIEPKPNGEPEPPEEMPF